MEKILKITDFTDTMLVWELRGNYPDVPYFENVDVTELTKGDDNPMFLTLPIGKVDAKSGNGRFYDDKWLQELEKQVIANRPVGIMGHLREEDMGTEFPPEAIHWVGVKRVNEMLWGKGYVPPGEARERVRRYKATNKSLATSIYAKAQGVWDTAVNAYRMVAETMQLHQIDIGPADRVGIPDLARIPLVTAEMRSSEQNEEIMDKLQVINEMTAEDARLLPQPVREAVLASVQEPAEVKLVTELRAALGVDEKADLAGIVSEMKTYKETQQKTAVSGRIKELVEDKDNGIKAESLRPLVIELVAGRNPQTVEEAESAYKTVTEMQMIKGALKDHLQTAMGPNQRAPMQPANGQSKYFNIPQEAN